MGGSKKWCKEDKYYEQDGGARNTCKENINYNRNISLIQTIPTSSTKFPPQPHTNDSIADSGCTGHYLDALATIFHTRELSENPINVNLPNSATMVSMHQAHIPLQNLSSQAKHAEIFPNIHSSLLSIGQLFDDEYIFTFDKKKVIVIKNKDKIIEGHQESTNGLWHFPLHHPSNNNKKSNILEQSTIKHWCQHIRPMALQHPRVY